MPFKRKIPAINQGQEKIWELNFASGKGAQGIAYAEIKESNSHYHKKITEHYFISGGSGTITIDGNIAKVGKGDLITIKPNQVHSAKGGFLEKLEVVVISSPAWKKEDHFVAKKG
ncbi:MAG: cupin domain-containing protein [Candidatus Diapherotrites archaeon]|nr:cupin domain-containing protein [Candidatus Diapherotrites archaeon]